MDAVFWQGSDNRHGFYSQPYSVILLILQHTITELQSWSQKWLLSLNTQKCCVVYLAAGQLISQLDIHF